jgi:hypothetical protein
MSYDDLKLEQDNKLYKFKQYDAKAIELSN